MVMLPTLPSPGLHYIGQLHENSLLRISFDQISEGQLEFQQLNQHFDTIYIGTGDEKREYTIFSGKTDMKAHLMKQFPDDTEAIETFFKIMKVQLTSGRIFEIIYPKIKRYEILIPYKLSPFSVRSRLRRPTTWQL